MSLQLLGTSLPNLNFVPTDVIGAALLAAGFCFSVVYVAALATILACHIDEL